MPSCFQVIIDGLRAPGCGSVAFPTAPLAFIRSRTGLRGFPVDRLPGPPASMQAPPLSLQVRSLRDLHSASETLPVELDRLRPVSRASPCRPSTSAPPSVHSQVALPLPFGPTVPTVRSRSVLVVSHHLDGLLHCEALGLVASRNRPWGPPRFQLQTPASSTPALTAVSGTGVPLE